MIRRKGGSGYFRMVATFREYRYGKGQRPVYDPSKPKLKPILTPQQRTSMVARVAGDLDKWSLSAFEFEAKCRHATRERFIGDGFDWHRSDSEAAQIVELGLKRIGAQRPTWEEGQRYFVAPPDTCVWCSAPVRPDDYGPKSHFCSVACAKMAIAYMDFERSYYLTTLGKSATSMIYKQAARVRQPAKHCLHCETMFFPDPSARTVQIYCSHRCYHKHERAPTYAKECEWCGKHFASTRPEARFCSKSCNEVRRMVRSGKWVPQRLSPPVFDYFFQAIAA